MVEPKGLKTANSHVHSLIHACCPTLFRPHASLSIGLYIGLSVCLIVLTTVLIVLTTAVVLSIMLSTVRSVLTNVPSDLQVYYRCKPSVPMSKQVLTAVRRMKWVSLQPFS